MRLSRTYILIIQMKEEEKDNSSIKNNFNFLKYLMLIVLGQNLSAKMQMSAKNIKTFPTPQLNFGWSWITWGSEIFIPIIPSIFVFI